MCTRTSILNYDLTLFQLLDRGDPEARYNYGVMRLTGQDGQPPDPAAAHGHFEAAAAQEFAPGMWFVVVCLLWFVCCGLFVVVCLLWFVCCGLFVVVCLLWFVCCGLFVVVVCCGLWLFVVVVGFVVLCLCCPGCVCLCVFVCVCVCVFCIVCPLSCLSFCSSPFNSLLFFCFPVSLVQPNTSVVFIVVVSVERVGDWPHGQRERHGHGTTARFHQSQRVLSPRGKTKLRRRPFQPGRTVQGRAGGGTGTWLYMVMHGYAWLYMVMHEAHEAHVRTTRVRGIDKDRTTWRVVFIRAICWIFCWVFCWVFCCC
jgi:hypothetical protein